MRRVEVVWPNTDKADRYRLFAEVSLELVSPQVWDSYRCHSLSTMTKIQELIRNCRSVERKTIPKPALEPIIEEVKDAIQCDLVLRDIFRAADVDLSIIEISLSETVEAILSRSRLIYQIAAEKYKKVCEDKIIEICHAGGSKFELITWTKLYFSHILNSGFSRQFIHSCINDVFYSKDIARCSRGLLKGLFARLDSTDKRRFAVVVTGNKRYIRFIAGVFNFPTYQSVNELNSALGTSLRSDFLYGASKLITIVDDVPALDRYGAVKSADSLLAIPQSLAALNPSTVRPELDRRVLTVDKKSGVAIQLEIKRPFQPRKRFNAQSGQEASAKELIQYIFNGSSEKGNLSPKLFHSLASASLAWNAQDPEARLVSLWAAFEALIPEPSKEGDRAAVRITHFAPLILPCASIDYLRDHFHEFLRTSEEHCRDQVRKLIGIEQLRAGGEELLIDLLLDKGGRKNVFDAVSGSPLLMNRLFKLCKIVDDPKIMENFWNQHDKRVSWQIHRIYRERNSVVHNGTKSPFIDGLVYNAHTYYRSVIVALERSYARFGVGNPDQALELVASFYSQKKSMLNDATKAKKADQEKWPDVVRYVLFKKSMY